MSSATDRARPLAPLTVRRRLVLIGVLGLLILLVSQFLRASGVASAAWSPLATGGIVALVFGGVRLVMPGHLGLPQMDRPDLDERQRAVVTHAYASAYRVLAVGLMVACAYPTLTDLFAGLPGLGRLSDSAIMVVGLIWVVIGLPSAILAWNEPDPAD